MHRRVRDTESPGCLRMWLRQAPATRRKIATTTASSTRSRYHRVDGRTRAERFPARPRYDLRASGGRRAQSAHVGLHSAVFPALDVFPHSSYVQQHPRDGQGFLSVPMQGRASLHAKVRQRRMMCRRSASCESQVCDESDASPQWAIGCDRITVNREESWFHYRRAPCCASPVTKRAGLPARGQAAGQHGLSAHRREAARAPTGRAISSTRFSTCPRCSTSRT